MAIRFGDSLEESNYLLEEILKHEEINNCGQVKIGSYQNGREQGYSLNIVVNGEKKSLSFAVTRGGDDLVLYFGDSSRMGISEDAYRNSSSYTPGDYEDAAEYAIDILKENSSPAEPQFVEYHPSLEIAKEVLDKVMADERANRTRSFVESLQEEDKHGYRIVCSSSTAFFDIGIVKEEDKIAVYKGNHASSGLPYDGDVQRFDLDDVEGAVEYFFFVMELEDAATL